MRGILVFGASGPPSILSSYPSIDDPDLLMKLAAKGIDRFMAWEASLDRCRDLYGYSYRDDMEDSSRPTKTSASSTPTVTAS